MENFSENDKEFLKLTQQERSNLESSGNPLVADGVKSGLGKVYDEAEGLTSEAFAAAMPKTTGKILADPTYGVGGTVNRVRKFRKKPVVVEALRYRLSDVVVQDSIIDWIRMNGGMASYDGDKLIIGTLEGPITASVGDWIIRGVNGEFYPCKPDIFEKTYDNLDDELKGSKKPGLEARFKLVEGPELHVIFTDNDKNRIETFVFTKEATMNDLFIAAERFEEGVDLANAFNKTTASDIHHFASRKEKSKEEVFKLLERARGLVGNPRTNFSASTDIACENWNKDYDAWKLHHGDLEEKSLTKEKPDLYELVFESYHMLLELTEKKDQKDLEEKEFNEAAKQAQWEIMVKNAPIEEMYERVKSANEELLKVFKLRPDFPIELLSDGYHTFKELYEFRLLYNAALFNEWAIIDEIIRVRNGNNDAFRSIREQFRNVHKSWMHNDGELCFNGGWFIVSAMLPTGIISNHYKAEYWEYFKVPEVEKALFEFDGHTSEDVQKRLTDFILTKTD